MKHLLATILTVAFLAGCSGGASPSAVPGAPAPAAQPAIGTQPASSIDASAIDDLMNPEHYPPVQSSCGNHVRIVIAGFVDCRFTQKGNHGGSVKIDTSHLMEIGRA